MNVEKILDNEPVPSGEFGFRKTDGNPQGSIHFTNKGRVNSRVAIYGSDDNVNWVKIGGVKAAPGKTRLKKLKVFPLYIAFHNARAASGPATLLLASAD